jgi:hypothetical protein
VEHHPHAACAGHAGCEKADCARANDRPRTRPILNEVAAPHATRRQHGPWLFATLTAIFWFEVLWRSAEVAGRDWPAPAVIALVGLASQLGFTVLEASLAVAVWASFGHPARWSVLMPLLLTASAAEAAAVAVSTGQPALAEPWPALLAGARAAGHGGDPGAFLQAFAAFGLLTVVRLVLATHAHATAAGTTWRRAALVVLGFYLASRCALWWTLDLMRGHSFEATG